MKIVKKKISDLKPAECCCGVVLMHHNGSGICEGRASRHYRFKYLQMLIEKLMLNICTSPLLLQIPCYQQ